MAVSTRDGLSVPVGDALGFYASSLTAELKHDPRASFWDGARKIHGARTIESVYGPFVYSDVNEKVVGVTTVGGRMTFSLVCNGEAVGADVAMSIRDSAMARLKEAVE
jgi:hypothetical protein